MVIEKKCADIGRRLQTERELLGYKSQESLGLKMGKSKRTITNWESGGSAPDAADLLRMAGLGFDISFIVLGVRAAQKVCEPESSYGTPARMASAEIAGLRLSLEDAELVLALARRLEKKT